MAESYWTYKKMSIYCRFCVSGDIAPELLSAFVFERKGKMRNSRMRNTDELL